MRTEKEIRELLERLRQKPVVVEGYSLTSVSDAGGWWEEVLEWVLNDKKRRR